MTNEKGFLTPDKPAMDQPLFTLREIVALMACVMIKYELEDLAMPLKALGEKANEHNWTWRVVDGVLQLQRTE